MAERPTCYACSVGPCLVKLTVTKVCSECSVDEPWMSEFARLSRPGRLFLCSAWALPYHWWNFRWRRCTTTVTLTALTSTQTHSHSLQGLSPFWLSPFSPVTVLTRLFCRRFGVAVMTCRCFDHEPVDMQGTLTCRGLSNLRNAKLRKGNLRKTDAKLAYETG